MDPLPTACEPEAIALALRHLLAHPEAYLSPAYRGVRTQVASLFALQRARGEGLSGAAKEARAEALRQAHQKRDNDRRQLEACALREGRLQRLNGLAQQGGAAEICAPLLVLDGAVEAPEQPAGGAGQASSGGGGAGAPPSPGALPELHKPRSCYTCHSRYRQLHHFYDALCPPCAELNWAKRHARADLRGRTALVTGARVKIGFHVALKLLRCGARVVATSRFPRDAAARFAAQGDFGEWGGRLEVIGLDFRDLGALEAFCAALCKRLPRLDILINNACQTVRRPAGYYAPLMRGELGPLDALPAPTAPLLEWNATLEREREAALLGAGGAANLGAQNPAPRLLADASLEAVNVNSSSSSSSGSGSASSAMAPMGGGGGGGSLTSSAALSQLALVSEDATLDAALLPAGLVDVNAQQLDLRRHNSWTMVAEEVETPELAEVMAINAMAPFILCARLKGIMSSQGSNSAAAAAAAAAVAAPCSPAHAAPATEAAAPPGIKGAHGARPPPPGLPPAQCSFIVNVSSMEGKFYFFKLPTHPHTNMAKAALNMLTRTTSGEYARACIFMTAVDTGWINEELPRHRAAEKAARNGFVTPLDEVDAAARILDPILEPLAAAAAGDGGGCAPLYGAFLKDYKPGEW